MRKQPPPATRGAQLLLAALAAGKISLNAYGRTKGYSNGRMSRVVRGELKPSLDMANDMSREYGIPHVAWEEKPVKPEPRRRTHHESVEGAG